MTSTAGRILLAAVLGGGFLAIPAPVPAAAADAPGCTADRVTLIDEESRPLRRLNAEALASRASGRGVVVAVVDSGVDPANVHLRGDAVLPGKSFVGGQPDGRVDSEGHGTAIAGIIAARAVDGSGVMGLAPAARILPVRVFVGSGDAVAPANRPRVDRIAQGIRWAATRADIINVSISAPADDPALREAVRFAQSKGALVVASVGNRTEQAVQTDAGAKPLPDGERFPAAYKDVLGVTAVNYGEVGVAYDSVGGPHVDVAAPGVGVLTAFRGAGDCIYATTKSSTSWATGYVSAAAALLREVYPKESAVALAQRLIATAAEAPTGVRSADQGWGLVKPVAAIDLVLDTVPRTAPASGLSIEPAVASTFDPRAEAREGTAWWVVFGAAGLALILLLGGVAGARRGRRA